MGHQQKVIRAYRISALLFTASDFFQVQKYCKVWTEHEMVVCGRVTVMILQIAVGYVLRQFCLSHLRLSERLNGSQA